MTFTPKKYKDIFDEMRAMSQVVTDFEVGSVTRTIYESFSYELALMYEKMQMVYLSAYVDTAVGNQLDQVVAVLGITRSLPDFAEGSVSFLRDGAGPDILIPAGTLVATKESSTGEKFVYETGKEATLTALRTSVDVAIRARERGEASETAAGSIIVMPRPVPGIKSVINNDPIRLIGKRRETDEELRDRAKSTLISSGKATVLSIENTLLSLSGVRDARVRENFHFARADTTVVRGAGGPGVPLVIPRGTRVLAQSSGGPPVNLPFRTMETVSFQASDGVEATRQVRIEGLVEGKIGEIPNTTGIVLIWNDPALGSLAGIQLDSPALLEDFGLIDVYVDAPRLSTGTPEERAAEAERLNAAIRSVRAAGIFAILRPTVKAPLSAVFRLEIPASLNLNPEERRAFEESVEDSIVGYIGALRMGKPLLYGKLIKEILSLENIDNLADFKGKIIRNLEQTAQVVPVAYADSEKAIRVEEFERIEAEHICVATEDKVLRLHIAFLSPGIDADLAGTVATALSEYLDTLESGQPVVLDDLFAVIDPITSIPNAETFQVRPETWCPGPPSNPRPLLFQEGGQEKIEVTFVERPALGILFGYDKRLELAGALKLTLPLNIPADDRLAVRMAVRVAITEALDRLGPEEDVLFDTLIAAALTVNQVLAAELTHADFIPFADGVPVLNIVDKQKVDVPPLMRAFAGHLLIHDSISQLDFSLTELQVTTANAVLNAPAIRAALLIAWNNILNGYQAGDQVAFTDLKSGLENRVPGIPYTIQALEVTAFNEIDAFFQVRDLGDTAPFHTRSIEVPKATLLPSNTPVITIA